MIYRNSKSSELTPQMKTTSVLKPKKKQKEVIFDRDSLTCEYHHAMLSGLALVCEKLCAKIKAEPAKKLNILVLGTGTGILSMFLRTHFAALLEKLTTVEIDAGVLLVARDHFGFKVEDDELVDSVCGDAYEFVFS